MFLCPQTQQLLNNYLIIIYIYLNLAPKFEMSNIFRINIFAVAFSAKKLGLFYLLQFGMYEQHYELSMLLHPDMNIRNGSTSSAILDTAVLTAIRDGGGSVA